MTRKHVVILTGAGISAESGISTFRDSGGLWEGHDVMEVASPEGWEADPKLVLDFYNLRRKNVMESQPNPGHKALAALEKTHDVSIITQNVDDLHERAGSSRVMHLHGELLKVRSTSNAELIYEWKKDLNWGDKCEKGFQLRPHIVWFGEMVPMMEEAALVAQSADVFMVIGTSLVVYPAAGLVQFAPAGIPIYMVDPKLPENRYGGNVHAIEEPAGTGVQKAIDHLRSTYG